MEKALKLYTIKNGNVSAFPNGEHQIILTSFNYDAKRMGGAPIITATVMYPICLDGKWDDEVFVEFNGERYFLKQTPTSSKSNTEPLYKHECEFVSERISLDNIYFLDVVVGDPQDEEIPVSNSATFSFFGTIKEFAKRLNAAFEYAKLGYRINTTNLNDGEEKLLSFDKTTLSTALQESYNQFEIPYYFVGKNIYFDFFENAIKDSFKYGFDRELLSITKNNANQKIVNRCGGIGSADNLPYYYPNEHPLGKVNPVYTDYDNVIRDNAVSISNYEKFANQVKLSEILKYQGVEKPIPIVVQQYYKVFDYDQWKKQYYNQDVSELNNAWFLAPTLEYSEATKEKYLTTAMGVYENYSQATFRFEVSPQNYSICFKIGIDRGNAPKDISLYLDFALDEQFAEELKKTLRFRIYKKLNNETGGNFGQEIEPPQYIGEGKGWYLNDIVELNDSFFGVDDCFYLVLNFDNYKGDPYYIEATRYEFNRGAKHKGWGSADYGEAYYAIYSTDWLKVTPHVEYTIKSDGIYKALITDDINSEEVDEVFWGFYYTDPDSRHRSYAYLKKETYYIPQHKYIKLFVAHNGDPTVSLQVTNRLTKTFYFEPRNEFRNVNHEVVEHWALNDNPVELESYGLAIEFTPNLGDEISFEMVEGSLVPYQKNLMPPIYIQSGGKKRFYNALNGEYLDENGKYYNFQNTYTDAKRKEHIEEFPDIKPSIENVKNENGENINTFIEFAYDEMDNDEVDAEGNYIHPYFYAKLKKFGGYKIAVNGVEKDASFNLFKSASTKGDMTISMTSGHCGGCNFVIAVNEENKKNTLQVDDNGGIVFSDGKAVFGEPQDKQNDTINNEVWVALKKDTQAYGTLMPNKGLYPDINDTFVITNIAFPVIYLREAEERLKDAIIKFMYENNKEKFTFSIKFSRIYLEEHPDVLAQLNENSLIQIEYNGEIKTLYVNSFAYKKDANTALPEITVELADTISASQNTLQTAISEVKTDVLNRVQKMDVAAMVASKFISKDTEDYAKAKITFNKGLAIGDENDTVAVIDDNGDANLVSQTVKQFISTPQFVDGFAGVGFKLWLDELGKSNLTIDNITARETFRVFEMLVTKLRAVNGGLFISAANGVIKDVIENDEYYNIILENQNTFIAGDYMRCQVMNGLQPTEYWVEVHSVKDNACQILKEEFNGAVPVIGNDVVLDGSKVLGRQSAIHISASDDGQPRIDIFSGINKKTHNGCLRTRLGDLTGIIDEYFGTNIPSGYGLYSDNAYLKGDFILRSTGEDVATQFKITNEGIKSSVESLQAEAIKGRTLLYNASFTKGLEGWLTSDDKLNFTNGLLLLSSGSAVTNSVYVSGKPIFDDVYCLTINNGWIKQFNDLFVDKPQFDAEKQYPLFFSTNIRCNESGVLNVLLVNIEPEKATAFKGVCSRDYSGGDTFTVDLGNGTAWHLELAEEIHENAPFIIVPHREDFAELYNLGSGTRVKLYDWWTVEYGNTEIAQDSCHFICSKRYEPTIGFSSLDIENLSWNGQGDFYLSFTGEADFYGLTIFTEKTEVRHKTFFDMSDRLINFGAQQLDASGAIKKESGIVVQPEGAGLYAKDENGNQSRIATYADGKVVLEGSEIQLKGNLTTDGKFKVREDGSIEATNGSFNGYLINKPLKVTEDNYRDFFTDYNDDYTTAWTWKGWVLCSCVMLKYTSAMKNGASFGTVLTLPSIDARNVSATEEELDTIRSFIGQTITVYNDNDTGKTLVNYHKRIGTDTTDAARNMEAYSFATFACSVSTDANGTEMIYWEEQAYGKIKTT